MFKHLLKEFLLDETVKTKPGKFSEIWNDPDERMSFCVMSYIWYAISLIYYGLLSK